MTFYGIYVLLSIAFGFVVGVIVNLIADYLPAQRHHHLASISPFVSRSAVPPKPTFFPRHLDDKGNLRLWPVPLWSGTVAALMNAPVYEPRRRMRHILTELGLAAALGWIV